jgi:hypothetical protein
MNSGRTHTNHILAFPKHADYGCALTVAHLSFTTRVGMWLRAIFKGV